MLLIMGNAREPTTQDTSVPPIFFFADVDIVSSTENNYDTLTPPLPNQSTPM